MSLLCDIGCLRGLRVALRTISIRIALTSLILGPIWAKSAAGLAAGALDESLAASLVGAREAQVEQRLLESMPSNILARDSRMYSTHDNRQLQDLIDKALGAVLTSPAASDLCAAMARDAAALVANTGLSDDSAAVVQERCARSGDSMPALPGRREYIFVLAPHPLAHVDSWTHHDFLGKTFILVHDDFTWQDLLQVLAHELYVTMDRYSALSTATYEDEGIRLMLPEQYRDRKDEFTQIVFRAIAFPIFRFSLIALRGFHFEVMVLKSLGKYLKLDLDEIAGVLKLGDDDSEANCFTTLRGIATKMFPHQVDYTYSHHAFGASVSRVLGLQEVFSEEDFNFVLTHLESLNVEVKVKGRKRVGLCRFLATPAIGTTGMFFRRGPRPRTGNGW